jgi:hypothetical protein
MFARRGRISEVSVPAGRARWLFERVEAAAQECDHRVDRGGKVGGALRLLLGASAPLGQDVEGGGEGSGDNLRTNVVRGSV